MASEFSELAFRAVIDQYLLPEVDRRIEQALQRVRPDLLTECNELARNAGSYAIRQEIARLDPTVRRLMTMGAQLEKVIRAFATGELQAEEPPELLDTARDPQMELNRRLTAGQRGTAGGMLAGALGTVDQWGGPPPTQPPPPPLIGWDPPGATPVTTTGGGTHERR